jgi:hypothetical protein
VSTTTCRPRQFVLARVGNPNGDQVMSSAGPFQDPLEAAVDKVAE